MVRQNNSAFVIKGLRKAIMIEEFVQLKPKMCSYLEDDRITALIY